eukprot:scaffold2224_cov261-Pinguiococcus_pyrenoidosus.AAC.29
MRLQLTRALSCALQPPSSMEEHKRPLSNPTSLRSRTAHLCRWPCRAPRCEEAARGSFAEQRASCRRLGDRESARQRSR